MATPKRLAKPGNNWTFNELNAYNIQVNTVDTQTFFGICKLPAPAIDPIILENVDFPDNLPVVKSRLREVHFFNYLWDTTDKDQSSYADDFTYNLLSEVLEFDVPNGGASTRPTFPFIMSGQCVKAIPTISIRDKDCQIILVQKDKVSLLFPCCRAFIAEHR